MRITLTDTVEHVHKWIDPESGKVKRHVIRARKGATLDSEYLRFGEPARALLHLLALGLAEEA